MDEQEVLRRAEAVGRLLTDESMIDLFASLDRQYYEEFRTALTPESREQVWAKAHALADLQKEMRVIVERGTRLRAVEERKSRRAEATERVGNRKGR